MIMAAQQQVLGKNNIKWVIDKAAVDGKFRMCVQVEETVAHIESECP